MPDSKFLELHGGQYRFVRRIGKERVQRKLYTDSLSQARKLRDLYLATGSWHSTSMVEQGQAWRKHLDSETDKVHSASVLFGDVYEDIADKHGSESANIFARVADGEMPIFERLEAWHSDKRAGLKLKERTKADHRTGITRLVAWMNGRKLEPFVPEVTQKIAEDYLDHLIESDVHPRTGNKALSSIRSMWNFMRVHPNPWSGVTMDESNTTDEKERAFTNAEIMNLLDGPADKTMQAVMRMACLTGARLEELFKLQISDVKDGLLWIVNSKRKGPVTKRPVPIHNLLAPLIEELCKGRGQGDFVIAEGNPTGWDGTRSMAFSKRFATYRRKVGVDEKLDGQRRSKVNFHSFRRWLATQFEALEVSEIVAARIVGHKLDTMTYGLYSDGANVEVLRDGLNKVKLPGPALK